MLVPGATIDADELVRRCRTQLAVYKVPKRWTILLSTDELPYTTTNKIDKRQLIERLAQGSLPVA